MHNGLDETREHKVSPPPTAPVELPDATSVIERPTARPAGQTVLLFVAVAAAGFLVGIGVASVRQASAPDGPAEARALIGPRGGTLRFEGGILRVPKGALRTRTEIVVRRSPIDRQVRIDPPGSPSMEFAAGEIDAFRFEPADLAFARSVELEFAIPSRGRTGAVFVQDGARVHILDGRVDRSDRTVVVRVRDFDFGESS